MVSSVGDCLVAGQPFEGLMSATFPFKLIFKVHIHSNGFCRAICTPALPCGVCLVRRLYLLPFSLPPLVSTLALNSSTALQSQVSGGALSFGPLEKRRPAQFGKSPEMSLQGQGRAGSNEGWGWGGDSNPGLKKLILLLWF